MNHLSGNLVLSMIYKKKVRIVHTKLELLLKLVLPKLSAHTQRAIVELAKPKSSDLIWLKERERKLSKVIHSIAYPLDKPDKQCGPALDCSSTIRGRGQ